MAVVNDVPQLVDKKGGMEPYYLKYIKDGPFHPKTAEGDAKLESQWTSDERRVVVQDQRPKSIIISCLLDDIMESVISCVSAKETWTDLVHSFEAPSDTKENRIMDLKLEYQTFRAKSTESLSQTYTRYKTLINELANDGVNLSKHEINVGFVNSLPEKWLTFSQGLRNANHTQTLDLADIYGRFVYEDNLIQRRSSEEYLRDLDIEYHERALLENSKRFIKRRNNFSNSNSQADPKFQKDYKAEYKKIKAKLALLEASPSKVSDEEEVTQVKVLMALADDELTVRKSHARNGEWVDITIRKKKVLGGELFTESSSKINKNENLFIPASIGYDQEMVPKTKDWVERLNPDSKLPNFNTGRILVLESEAVNESLESTETLNTPESSRDSEAESLTPLPPLKNLQGASPSLEVMPLNFQPHSPKERPGLGIMKHTKHETQDSSNKSVLGTVTMLIDEKVNSNQKTQESNSKIQKTESSKSVDSSKMSQDSKPKVQNIGSSKSLRPKPIQKPQFKSENYKAQPYQYASSSKQILKAKAKPVLPCKHCGFNDHRPDDCINYPECEICGSYDHFTSGHNRVIHIRGGVLSESSQSNESSIDRHIREPIWYLHSGCSRSMTGVKSYLHKYVEQPGPKVVFGDNSSCITEGYGSINYGGVVFTKVAFVNGLKYNLISISQLCDAKYIVQFDDKQRTIFNANKKIVLIAPRRNDVYVLNMSSLTPNGACFFAKASKSVNWLWHKRLSHLNFKNINKLAKQNKVLGLPSLCLHLLHMDLFGLVSPMSINHEKYTLVIVDEYSRMVENQNDVKVKQIRTNNGTEFRNHELESFCDEKGISQNFSSPYTIEQNGIDKKKNITLIEAARTMPNGSVLSKHLWTEVVRIACYTQNRSIVVKRHDKTPYEIFRERIPDISYFHMFGCPVFIHNYKDHLGKFDAKADDGYFLGYSFVSIAFRVFNTRRQQVEETYHVIFDEIMEAIKQYQVYYIVSYYIIIHGCSLTELTQENNLPEVIAPNEPDIPHTEDTEGPPDLINTEGTHEQNVQNDQMITQPTDIPSGNNTEVLGSIIESLVPDVPQSHISNQASTSSHPVPQDRWSRDQHIELLNIIGD
ncbi:retrovirus-related pol polyprotein from transposon TNT 1-94 [Tanacetum coccineum]